MAKTRYYTLDLIRGFTLLHMAAYHALWDIVNLYDKDWIWFEGVPGDIWQQYICWSFILLSGFCVSLGKHTVKRGIILLLCGTVISAVTLLVTPESRVLFGVLTLLGSCSLFMIPAGKISKKANPTWGLIICFTLFLLLKTINQGYLGFFGWKLIVLPESWYANLLTTYLGLPAPDFYSSDYFSVFPWLFLFLIGYFLYQLCEKNQWLSVFSKFRNRPLEWVGRHSLILYMIHQPLIYLFLFVSSSFFRSFS